MYTLETLTCYISNREMIQICRQSLLISSFLEIDFEIKIS